MIKILPQEGDFEFQFPALTAAVFFWLFLMKATLSEERCLPDLQFYGSFTNSKILFTKAALGAGHIPMKNILFSLGASF